MKNFLTFVNEAIAESKATLDPLTPANFATPPRTILYERFKTWVNRSYREALMERNEWHFQKERTITTVGPRIHVVATDVLNVPQVGDTLRGQISQFDVVVTAIELFEDDELTPGTLEYTLDITLPDGNRVADFAVPELIDVVAPSPVPIVGAFTFQGAGLYAGRTPQFRVDKWKATIFDNALIDMTAPGTNQPSALPLVCVPWDAWNAYNFSWTNTGERPYYITQNPQGLYDLYPRPTHVYPLEIYYTRGPSEMVDWDDTPLGFPELYEDYILWKTIEEFADFDSNTRLFARAQKKVAKYNYWLERDEMPDVTIGRSKFDRNDRYNYNG